MLIVEGMRKADVLRVYKTNVAVANALGITDSAVSQWGEIIPPMAAHELAKRSAELRFDRSLYIQSGPRIQKIVALLAAAP
jgi:hypothetical protein